MKLSATIAMPLSLGLILAMAGAGSLRAQPPKDADWARVTEDDRAIKIETDKLEAVIPKKDPRQWMTGIEKGSFLDKATGFREVGDGLMVVDWLMGVLSAGCRDHPPAASSGTAAPSSTTGVGRPVRSGTVAVL